MRKFKFKEKVIIISSKQEADFWQKAYIGGIDIIASMINTNISPILTAEDIADKAIMDFRKRDKSKTLETGETK